MNHLSRLPELTGEQVEALIRDLWLQEQGISFYYAVDPHEIYDFCFPLVRPDDSPTDAQRQTDDQIALYELFFRTSPRPILLAEYGPELESILEFVRVTGERHYSKVEYAQRLIDRSEVGKVSAMTSNGELEAYVRENLSHLLAAIMGVHLLGGERLKAITGILKQAAAAFENVVPSVVTEGYRESALVDDIFEQTIKHAEAAASRGHSLDLTRVRRSARTDAIAIDQLVHVNAEIELLRRGGIANANFVVAYVSSAERTRRTFALDSVKRSMPDVKGVRFSMARTRTQVFAFAALRVLRPGRRIDFSATRQNLEDLKIAVSGMRRSNLRNSTSEIVDPLIERNAYRLLEVIQAKCEQNQTELLNLGLANNIEEYYHQLSEIRQSNEGVRIAFRRIYDLYRNNDHALKAMRLQLQIMVGQSELGFGVQGAARTSEAWLRDGRDAVTSSLQYLPICPRLVTARYREPLQNLLAFLRLPALQMPHAIASLLIAYDNILSLITEDARLDNQASTDEIGDRELLRCYLYFSFLAKEGDERALRHAKSMVEQLVRENPQSPHILEFIYVACWAARRTLAYQDAFALATQGINRSPFDPRMYHGRELTIYAWLSDQEATPCPYRERDAIADAEKALMYYKNSTEDWREMIGVTLNNLSHLHSTPENSVPDALTKAREYFSELLIYMPKGTWGNQYPEFYHTSALLLYKEALLLLDEAQPDRERARQNLASARVDADNAVRYFPTKLEHRQLRDNIELCVAHPEFNPGADAGRVVTRLR